MTRSRRRKLKRLAVKWASMPLASAVAAGLAVAQEQQGENTLEEVVVTAQKRSEDLQKVPISLQVLGGEKLEQLQVNSFESYARFLPNVSYQTLGPSQAQLYFRGISSGSDGLHAGSLPGTGTYLDEIPVTTIGNTLDVHVYDIQRVEALAGPQGTLYGASSLSGTLRIITNKPDKSKFSAGYDVKGMTYSHGDPGGTLEGFVNIPLSDRAAVRLVGYVDYQGGYIDNVPVTHNFTRRQAFLDPPIDHPLTVTNAPVVKPKANSVASYGGRAALRYDINDNWSVTPTVLYQSQRANGNFAFDPKLGDLKSGDFRMGRNKDRWTQTALTVEGKISNFNLVYSGGYMTRKVDNVVDYADYTVAYDTVGYTYFTDGSGNFVDVDPTQYVVNHDKYTKMSHEIRLSSPDDQRLRFVTGLFYQRQTDFIRAEFTVDGLPPYVAVPLNPNILYVSDQDRIDRDYAVFGDMTYDITDKLKISGGIREFWVKNTLYGFFGYGTFGHTGTALCYIPGPLESRNVFTSGHRPCINTDKKVTENGETHRINLTYQFNDDLMIYGTYSTGFRPGGNNRRPEAKTWAADTITNLEVGWKTSWLDRRLRFNGALFYEKWKGVQTSVQGANGINSIVNAGDAKVQGIEGEITWLPIDNLTLAFGGSYLNKAEIITDFCKPSALGEPVTDCDKFYGVDAKAGSSLPVAPKVKYNGTARYRFDVGGHESFVQGAFVHQSSTSYSLEDDRDIIGDTKPFTTFDLSGGTSFGNANLELYVQNVFDKRGELGRLSECGVTYCFQNYKVYPTPPRSFGVRFGQKF